MSTIAPLQQDSSLIWGVLSLLGQASEEDENQFEIRAMADGTHLGTPERVIEFIDSVMNDMAFAVVTGVKPRDVVIRLKVTANDGEGLGAAEAALAQQYRMERPPPLVWTPPTGLSAPCVFDVEVAELTSDTSAGWDLAEKTRGAVYYTLTLTCQPWVRAVETTVVPALPIPTDPGGVVDWDDVDTCDSTTGWTIETNAGSPAGPLAHTDSGETAVRVTAFVDSPNDYLRLVRTGSIVVPTDYYLALDVWTDPSDPGGTGQWRAHYNGAWHSPTAIVPGIGEAGSTRLFFAGVGTITSLKVTYDFLAVPIGGGQATLDVWNVATTDTIGSSTTTTSRQQSRLVTVKGSVPTKAQLRVFNAAETPLGSDVLVYTSRNTDWQPNLRTWITDSELAAPDPARVSGSYHTLASPTQILIPANLIASGTYALMAYMDISASGTLEWQARMTDLDGNPTVGSGVVFSGQIILDPTDGYQILNLADLPLPVSAVEGGGHAIEITLSGTISMLLDEAWLFSITDGVLTQVSDTEDMHGLEVRSPDLGADRPSVWGWQGPVGGPAAAVSWKTGSFNEHEFEPGEMLVFTVCAISLSAQCELEFFPRFHTRVWGAETA